jgi:hypothetical protein
MSQREARKRLVARREYAKKYMKTRVMECKKAGVCWRCKGEAVNTKSKTPLCAEHLMYQREVMRERRGSKPHRVGKPGRPPMFVDAVVADMRMEA